jgi:GT2 family glycosyltransferase
MDAKIQKFGGTDSQPLVSIIVLNYNTDGWLPKCFASIRSQTIIGQIETIFVDNHSTDSSVVVAKKLLADFPAASVIESAVNLGFCEGNNVGAGVARGRYLFFLNPDTWLEPDCMEKMVAGVEKANADAATPWVLQYANDDHQDLGFLGFDLFGLPTSSPPADNLCEVFAASGCAYLLGAEIFKKIGGFDREFFMYSEDADLSWRVWIAGCKLVGVPEARLHHRGAAGVNPAGGTTTIEYRTNDQKRFLTNRNCLLTLLKCGRNVLLLLVPLQMALVFVESLIGALMLRRSSYFRKACLQAFRDCWRMRAHILSERRRIWSFRKRGDFWMLRFFRLRLNRWDEVKRTLKFGPPRVDAK